MLLLSETWTTWVTEMAVQIAVHSPITIIYCNKPWNQRGFGGCCSLGEFFTFYGWNSQAKCTHSDNEKMSLLHKDWASRQELLVSWEALCASPMCVQEITLGLKKTKIQIIWLSIAEIMSPLNWYRCKEAHILSLGSALSKSGKESYHTAQTRLERANR